MDWTMFFEELIGMILPLLGSILAAVASVAAIKIKRMIESQATDETKSLIVGKVITFIDQTMRNATNSDKLNAALRTTHEWLSERNISVSDTELKILIESAVNAAHHGLRGTENAAAAIDD